MKEPVTDNRLMKVMLGFLVIGSLAAILGLYRAARDPETPAYFV